MCEKDVDEYLNFLLPNIMYLVVLAVQHEKLLLLLVLTCLHIYCAVSLFT